MLDLFVCFQLTIYVFFPAYYRVNYDTFLWNRIISALAENYTSIDVLNRAQIVDDAFNLARAGELSLSQALMIIDYLRNEREYYPWVSALNGFNYLIRILGENTLANERLTRLQLELLEDIRRNISFNLNTNNHIEIIKTRLILERACRLGEITCIDEALRLFQIYIEGQR